MDTLDRYLAREFFQYFLLVLAGLALLFLGIDFLGRVFNSSMPLAKLLTTYGYKVPAALQTFFPVACLLATLLVLTGMSRQNEILALYSAGIGNFRLVSSFVAMVATLSAVSFITFDSVVPLFAKKEILINRGLDPSREDLLVSFGTGGFWYRSGNIVYNVREYHADRQLLEDLRVYILNPDFSLRETLRARRGTFDGKDWKLENGFEVHFDATGFPIPTEFDKKFGVIPEKPSDFRAFKLEERTMRLKDLRRYISRNTSYGWDTTAQRVNYHERLALVFAPLILVLLGIPFATQPLRTQSVAKSIGLCFLIVFFYLLTFRMSLSLGKGGHLPPFVAGWTPNFAFLTAALLLMSRRS